jgi:hypothetical protein
LDLFDSIPKVLDFLPGGLNENETRRSPRKRNCAEKTSDDENNSTDSDIPRPPKLPKKKKINDKSIEINDLERRSSDSSNKEPSKTQKKQKRSDGSLNNTLDNSQSDSRNTLTNSNQKKSKSRIKITKLAKSSTEKSSVSTNSDNQALASVGRLDESEDDLEELSLLELFKLAEEGKFKKKLFIFEDTRKMYSERLHFYESNRFFACTFAEAHKKQLDFKCKFCKTIKHAYLGSIQNLTSHLTGHREFISKWLTPFEEKNLRGEKIIENDTFDFVRAIISANLPLAILENEHFTKCLNLAPTSI